MCLAALAALSGPARGQAGDRVSITLWTGAGGMVRADTIAPVRVAVANDSEVDFRDGEIVAQLYDVMGNPSVETRRPLNLPQWSNKAAFLYVPVPPAGATRIVVRFVNRGRTVATMEEATRETADSAMPVIAGVPTLPGGLPDTQAPRTGARIYATALIQPEVLAPRWEGLEMFDAIVLSPPPGMWLDRQKAGALADWVLAGGTLVVDCSAPSDGLRGGALTPILPFVPRWNEAVTLPLFDNVPMVVAGGDFTGGEVLLSERGVPRRGGRGADPGRPLVMARRHGLGRVVAFAFEPNDAAFRGWDESTGFWREEVLAATSVPTRADELNRPIAAVAGTLPDDRTSVKAALMQGADRSQPVGLRLGIVFLLTAAYALAVGPGDYLLVRWLKRPKLTWVTFPAMVVVFTLVGYGSARVLVGSSVGLTYGEYYVIFQDEGLALHTGVGSLFAPQRRDYTARFDGDGVVRPLAAQMNPQDRLRIDQDAMAATLRVPVWTRRVLATTRVTREYPLVRVTVTETADGAYAITLTNASERTLDQVAVLDSEGRLTAPVVHAVRPGATRTITASGRRDRYGVWRSAPGFTTRRPSLPFERALWVAPCSGAALNAEPGLFTVLAQAGPAEHDRFAVGGQRPDGAGTRYLAIIAQAEETPS
jgi:hypothetical protein